MFVQPVQYQSARAFPAECVLTLAKGQHKHSKRSSCFSACALLARIDDDVLRDIIVCYQQKPNNRILSLPFINGSQAQKIRLLDFWPAKDTIYIPERNLGNP